MFICLNFGCINLIMDRNSYEKLSIRESSKSLKKYGSTSKHVTKNENYLKHYVTNTDTLQGIALRYDVTIEQIRRANRLWATDSLFLREHLLIPVPENNKALCSTEQTSNSARHSQSTSHDGESDEESISDFLVKIDASIANTKQEVNKAQGNSEFASCHEIDLDRKRPAVSHMKQMVNNNIAADPYSPPQAVVVPKGRKIKSSMQRLEQQQDELFEL